MKISAGFEIGYSCPRPTPMVLLASLRPERMADLLTPQIIEVEPATVLDEYRDGFGNLAQRVLAPEGPVTFRTQFLIKDSGAPDPAAPEAEQHSVDELPAETLQFLLASRYCDIECLLPKAWSLFGTVQPGWPRLVAIGNYVHERIRFGYPDARATRTASEADAEGVGVCRDFAHLAVALCRCMNIPARYCTGYLGDIGVPLSPDPMDFSAWFEVFLGGRWHTYDARHNRPRVGRLLMAYGRDAADVAITTIFGPSTLTRFQVTTVEAD